MCHKNSVMISFSFKGTHECSCTTFYKSEEDEEYKLADNDCKNEIYSQYHGGDRNEAYDVRGICKTMCVHDKS